MPSRTPPNLKQEQHENPYEPPIARPSVPILWDLSTLTQIGFVLHSIVLGTYMLVMVREDVPPRVAILQIPFWLDQALFILNTLACILVVLPVLAKKDWPWLWKLALLWFELLINGLIVVCSNGFGKLLGPLGLD